MSKGFELNPGELIVVKSLTKRSSCGDTRFNYSAKRNHEFTAILLGCVKKDSEISIEAGIEQLKDMGFVPMDELEKILPKTSYNKVIKHYGFKRK